MKLRALALFTTIALATGLLAAPAQAITKADFLETRSEGAALVAELEAVRAGSLAAYDGQLVVRYADGLTGTSISELGSSLKNGASMWANDEDGKRILAVGAAFGGQTFLAPVFGTTNGNRKLMAEAAEKAGITLSTLVRIQNDQYPFWDLEGFDAEDVAQAQQGLSPLMYLSSAIHNADGPDASLSKSTSDGDTLYTWRVSSTSDTFTLVVRDGVLIELLEGADNPRSVVEVVAYGQAAEAPATPTEFVEAADVASYFTDALSYNTREFTSKWMRGVASDASAMIATVKKPAMKKVRDIIKKQLRSVIVNNIKWAVSDIKNGVRATTKTPWGPMTYTLTYNKRTQRVIVGS